VNGGEANLAHRLKQMQWIATALLALMAVIFVVTGLWRDTHAWLNPVWAFSEAALIGGLADWFAVTALFRHPLGLPIPHTAIVPNRKNQIGQSLARFVANHFLVRSALESELDRLNLAKSFGRWLEKPANARSIGRDSSRAAGWILESSESGPLRAAVAGTIRDLGQSLPTQQLLAALVEVLISGSHADDLVDSLVAYGRDQLVRNKHMIRERIRERSPWWLPKFVDEEIFDQIVAEIERMLAEVGEDAAHPARAALKERLGQLKDSIANDPEFLARSETLRAEFLQHPAVQSFGRDVWDRARSYLVESIDDPDSDLRRAIERELSAVGHTLAEDSVVAEEINSWLKEIIVYFVETYSEQISSIISTTIAQWDADATSRRIELHIGRDLQFIRINGTLVGGLVGVLLYFSWSAASG
jgi:uncharacterized membrane-anchored protein YjiN (DUF445 family)